VAEDHVLRFLLLNNYRSADCSFTVSYNYLNQAARTVEGAKLSFKCSNGVAVFKDGDKMWDFVGGALKPGETSIQCMIREIFEEMQIVIDESDIHYLCASADCENGIVFVTYLFEYVGSSPEFYKHFKRYSSSYNFCVPWLKRLYKAFSPEVDHNFVLPELPEMDVIPPPVDVTFSPSQLAASRDWAIHYPTCFVTKVHARKKLFPLVKGIHVFPDYVLFDWNNILPRIRFEMLCSVCPSPIALIVLEPCLMGLEFFAFRKILYHHGGYESEGEVFFSFIVIDSSSF